MREQTLKKIREFISCPEFGDENYGRWGAMRTEQRRVIFRLLEHIEFQKIDVEIFKEEIQRLEKEKHDLENQVAINKGAMRAYREAFENAHDEAVKDFSHFLIDKAKDGSVDICDLPDLVAEWRSPERKDAELMKEINAVFDEAAEGIKPSPTFCEGLIAGNNWYDARFLKVE